jgi:transposase
MSSRVRRGYPSDVTDEEWSFVLPYLLLCREDSGHREHDLWEVFNALRYVAKTGCPWRWVPGDPPPWTAVYQQMRRWLSAGCFETLVAGVQSILREWAGKKGQPTAVCLDIAAPIGHEVLVDVRASGLCHTDLLFATHDIVPTPSVLGHEVAGVVAEVGPDVAQIRVGDHVVGSLAQSCGACVALRKCRSTLIQLFMAPSSFGSCYPAAQRILIESKCYPLRMRAALKPLRPVEVANS